MIDGIVFHRARAVAALVDDFQPVVLRKFFAGLDIHGNPVSLGVEFACAAFIERESRIDQIAAIATQPVGAVECPRGFLAAGERDFQGAPRLVILGFISNQGIDPNSRFGLVIARAARVERSVFLDQCERVSSPVLALRFHDVNVREQAVSP